MEFRYYQMQDGIPILALLGEKWVQNYGRDVDYLHFHNYLEIGFCYSGEGELVLGEEPVRFAGREFTIIPPKLSPYDHQRCGKYQQMGISVYRCGRFSPGGSRNAPQGRKNDPAYLFKSTLPERIRI